MGFIDHRVVALAVVLAGGCADEQPTPSTYERSIQPILTQGCTGNTAGCHARHDVGSIAAGDLDVTSYATVMLRADLFVRPSDGSDPTFITKAIGVNHAGGMSIQYGSDVYLRLVDWIDRGEPE